MNPLSKTATWIAGALAVGWIAAGGALAFPGGHPPWAYVVGAGVVLVSFLVAPIGAGVALADLWRARRQGTATPQGAMTALGLNLLFLVVAIILWSWIWWEASRR